MLVRLEATDRDTHSLVIDEIDRFFGEIEDMTFFLKCVEQGKGATKIDDYTYFTVNKEQLLKFCKK